MMETGKKWESEVRSDRKDIIWLCVREWRQISTGAMLEEEENQVRNPRGKEKSCRWRHGEKNGEDIYAEGTEAIWEVGSGSQEVGGLW